LSGRGLCDELITRPEESYRLCCVVVCDLETSRMGAPYIYDISHLRVKQVNSHFTGTHLRAVYEIHFRKSRVDNRAQFIVSADVGKRLLGNVVKFDCNVHIF